MKGRSSPWRVMLFVMLVPLSCKDNPAGSAEIDQTLIIERRLHGVWVDTSATAPIPHMRFDTLSHDLTFNCRDSYNFRVTSGVRAKAEDGRILYLSDVCIYEPFCSFTHNFAYDQMDLKMMYYASDSALRATLHFTKSTTLAALPSWIDNLSSTQVRTYAYVGARTRSFAYADSSWFVLVESVSDTASLVKLRVHGAGRMTYLFPEARSMDVADGCLWLAGNSFLEKRSAKDTTLLAHYDLSQVLGPDGKPPWVMGLCVSGSIVYLVAWPSWILEFSTEGTLQRTDTCNGNLAGMVALHGKLWGALSGISTTIVELDPQAFHALHTYTIDGRNDVAFVGITTRDGLLACATDTYGDFMVFEVPVP